MDNPAADGGCYPSLLEGKGVNLTGIVTASDSHGFYLQDNNFTWSGIRVDTTICTTGDGASTYECSDSTLPAPKAWIHENIGNRVEVHGMVKEMNGTTEIVTVVAMTILGNASIPEPLNITTGMLGNCSHRSEAYEGMLVRVENATIMSDDADHGQIPINDGSGEAELEDEIMDIGAHFTTIFGDNIKGEVLLHAIGCVDYCAAPCAPGHENFELHPRTTTDLAGLVFLLSLFCCSFLLSPHLPCLLLC